MCGGDNNKFTWLECMALSIYFTCTNQFSAWDYWAMLQSSPMKLKLCPAAPYYAQICSIISWHIAISASNASANVLLGCFKNVVTVLLEYINYYVITQFHCTPCKVCSFSFSKNQCPKYFCWLNTLPTHYAPNYTGLIKGQYSGQLKGKNSNTMHQSCWYYDYDGSMKALSNNDVWIILNAISYHDNSFTIDSLSRSSKSDYDK